jgi:ComF family protein
LIHLLKYEAVLPAARCLGALLAHSVDELRLTAASRPMLVPVPLHSSKRRERQFNQAELIARAALKRLPQGFELDPHVLIRKRPTRSQVGLDREARIENIRGAFRVIAPERVHGRTLIVVDDVMTTGTTVSECARVLKRAGADKVFAATVARTLKLAGAQSFSHASQGEEVEAAQFASI